MFKIVKTPDPILKKKLNPFPEEGFKDRKKLKKLILEMKETMIANNGIGLSANQVGIDKSFFIALWNNKFYAFFNPEIIKHSKEEVLSGEGCLSIPDTLALVPRYKNITIKAEKIDGRETKLKAYGMLSIIFQHEIDHLNGILITDKAKEIKKIT